MAIRAVRDRLAGHVGARLADYFLGVLPVAVESGVETHLLSCARCLAEYDLVGAAVMAVAMLPDDVAAAIEARPASAIVEGA